MVIDDHEPSRRHLVQTLTNHSYEIAGEGASGKAALPLARSLAPEVIVMAVGLADMDGIEAARDLMRAHPLPIVLITSHYDAATIKRENSREIAQELVTAVTLLWAEARR